LNEYFYLSRIKQRSTCLCFYETDVIVFSLNKVACLIHNVF
jgi:hypothetical protein